MKTKNMLPIYKMVEEFQCPGCVLGHNTACGKLKLQPIPGLGDGEVARCDSHHAGTMVFPGGSIFLGMPKGFNKVGLNMFSGRPEAHKAIRLWPMSVDLDGNMKVSAKPSDWNKFNVPVWAMEQDGYLFVRTYCPRTNVNFIDVIEGGSRIELVPQAIDVGEFINDID